MMRTTTKKSNSRYYENHYALSIGVVNDRGTNSARVGPWRKSTEPNIQDIKSGRTCNILNFRGTPTDKPRQVPPSSVIASHDVRFPILRQ